MKRADEARTRDCRPIHVEHEAGACPDAGDMVGLRLRNCFRRDNDGSAEPIGGSSQSHPTVAENEQTVPGRSLGCSAPLRDDRAVLDPNGQWGYTFEADPGIQRERSSELKVGSLRDLDPRWPLSGTKELERLTDLARREAHCADRDPGIAVPDVSRIPLPRPPAHHARRNWNAASLRGD